MAFFKKAIIACVLALLCVFPVYAAEDDLVRIDLTIRTNEDTYVDAETSVLYEASVRNLRNSAWLRYQIDIRNENFVSGAGLTLDDISRNTSFVRHGEYFYLETPVRTNEDVRIADSFVVHMPNDSGVGNITIELTVDALDYASYPNPDWNSDDPWANQIPDDTETGIVGTYSGFGTSSTGTQQDERVYRYDRPTDGASVSSGEWVAVSMENKQWMFMGADGAYLSDGWYYLPNPYSRSGQANNWFHFDTDGTMSHGWIRASETDWYYTYDVSDGDLGGLVRGWHYDMDGRWYYLSPDTGLMRTGWQTIAGRSYYFTRYGEVPAQTWFWDTTFGQWLYDFLGFRSYGSMYINERTPDGYTVGTDGSWTGV